MGLPIPIPMLRVSFKSTFAVVVLHYSEGSHHRELQDHDERRSSREPRRSEEVKRAQTSRYLSRFASPSAAWAAASRAIGTRYGEQLT